MIHSSSIFTSLCNIMPAVEVLSRFKYGSGSFFFSLVQNKKWRRLLNKIPKKGSLDKNQIIMRNNKEWIQVQTFACLINSRLQSFDGSRVKDMLTSLVATQSTEMPKSSKIEKTWRSNTNITTKRIKYKIKLKNV